MVIQKYLALLLFAFVYDVASAREYFSTDVFRITRAVASFEQAKQAFEQGHLEATDLTNLMGGTEPGWLVVRIQRSNDEHPGKIWLSVHPYSLESIRVYSDAGKGKPAQAGSMVERSAGVIGQTVPVFSFEFTSGREEERLYIRVDTQPAQVVQLEFSDTLDEILQEPLVDTLTSFFWGVMVVTLLWMLLYAFRLKISFYYYYAAYLTCAIIGGAAVDGVLHSVIPLGMFNYLMCVLLVSWFVLSIETIRLLSPEEFFLKGMFVFRLCLWGVTISGLSMSIAGMFDLVFTLIRFSSPLFMITACYISWLCSRRGSVAGGLCCLAYALECIISFVIMFHYRLGDVQPFLELRSLYMYMVYVHIVMLNMAIVSWVGGVIKERFRAQVDLIEHLRGVERELEKRVHDRTEVLEKEIAQRITAESALHSTGLKLVAALAAERKALSSLRDMFLLVAHDIRTPLSVLSNYHEQGAGSAQAARRIVAELLLMVDQRMDAVSNSVVDPSEQYECVDLVALVKDKVERFNEITSSHSLEFFHEKSHIFVRCFRDMFDMLLANLINNSIVHTEHGVSIAVILREAAGHVHLVVQDDGPGVAPDELINIFERSRRGAASRGNGKGLGLYLVRRVVEHHNGTIEAEHCQPHGLRIIITLPKIAALNE